MHTSESGCVEVVQSPLQFVILVCRLYVLRLPWFQDGFTRQTQNLLKLLERAQAHGGSSAVQVMEALLWRGVLVVLCTPAVLTCPSGPACPVVQSPRALSLNGPNSSAEILCSTSRPNPTGLYLRGRFRGNRLVAYLDMNDGAVTRTSVNPEFGGRLAVVEQPADKGCSTVALRLSWLRVEDTDSYSCTWMYFDSVTSSPLEFRSKGSVIIVRERDPNKPCLDGFVMDLILIVLSLLAFVIAFFVFIGALVWKCTRRRRQFTPGRVNSRNRPRHPAPSAPPAPPEVSTAQSPAAHR
ncbi:uncharacterized protein LOC124475283 isoform X2 [Hypomesus transpacificus]|uniref:uncharacterized protein LOC124475283 isoform X2 n=1 Tax=Hypomesus transpacificus TaxID=137520 RepID=UPI001F0793BC|nr:uncharacterized protein LOC124475283 isoform X2 [Hypomesus transpacificus]